MIRDPDLSFWTLDWAHGTAQVMPTAGILFGCDFRLADGRSFQPFAQAPWATEAGHGDVTGHMRRLGGEFPCLPFGVGGAMVGAPPEWAKLVDGTFNKPQHGNAAEDDWRLAALTPGRIELTLDYPADHDIARLTRVISGDPDAPALDFELLIEARRPTRQPVALHPILKLPERRGSLEVEMDFERGLTSPSILPPGKMLTALSREFSSLDAVPDKDGGSVDLSRLPAAHPVEDFALMLGMKGPVVLRYQDEGVAVTVDWDRSLLPHCQIWLSDRALTSRPWDGRFRGVGIEPSIAAFDFVPKISTGDNPITAMGYATALDLTPEKPTLLRYRISVASSR